MQQGDRTEPEADWLSRAVVITFCFEVCAMLLSIACHDLNLSTNKDIRPVPHPKDGVRSLPLVTATTFGAFVLIHKFIGLSHHFL